MSNFSIGAILDSFRLPFPEALASAKKMGNGQMWNTSLRSTMWHGPQKPG